MNTASEDGAAERGYSPEASCKDSFRYRLVGENGRHRFVSVRFVGAEGCPSDDLEEIAMMLKGKWLDEVDVEALKRMECRGGRCCGCPQEVAKMVADIQQILLPEQGLKGRAAANTDGRRLGRRLRRAGAPAGREDATGHRM